MINPVFYAKPDNIEEIILSVTGGNLPLKRKRRHVYVWFISYFEFTGYVSKCEKWKTYICTEKYHFNKLKTRHVNYTTCILYIHSLKMFLVLVKTDQNKLLELVAGLCSVYQFLVTSFRYVSYYYFFFLPRKLFWMVTYSSTYMLDLASEIICTLKCVYITLLKWNIADLSSTCTLPSPCTCR